MAVNVRNSAYYNDLLHTTVAWLSNTHSVYYLSGRYRGLPPTFRRHDRGIYCILYTDRPITSWSFIFKCHKIHYWNSGNLTIPWIPSPATNNYSPAAERWPIAITRSSRPSTRPFTEQHENPGSRKLHPGFLFSLFLCSLESLSPEHEHDYPVLQADLTSLILKITAPIAVSPVSYFEFWNSACVLGFVCSRMPSANSGTEKKERLRSDRLLSDCRVRQHPFPQTSSTKDTFEGWNN